MNYRYSKIIYLSILWGALFFSWSTAAAVDIPLQEGNTQINDSMSINPYDSLSNDTIILLKETAGEEKMVSEDSQKAEIQKDPNCKSPRTATILSAVVPGLGQIYNGKFWKVPVIYALGGAVVYCFDYSRDLYLENRQLLWDEQNKAPADQDEQKLRNYESEMNVYRRYRDYTVLFIGILYIANVVDAMADAYFCEFDISDDLTLRIDPVLNYLPGTSSTLNHVGLQISLKF